MPFLCDVNVVVAGAARGHSLHEPAANWLNGLTKGDAVLIRTVQLAFLRLMTNASVMKEDVLDSKDAWRAWAQLLSDDRFLFFAGEPTGIDDILSDYAQELKLTPTTWNDAYLAAFSRAAEIPIVTFDRKFSRFEKLDHVLIER